MRLLRLCFRAAIDEPNLPAAPEQFDGYRLGEQEEEVSYGV